MARVVLRAAGEGDLPFLYRVYASTRADVQAIDGWSAGQKEAFLAMQFQAQHAHYHRYYPQARFDLIEVDGEPAGRLYVERGERETRIIDIALLPAWRGRGVGSELLRGLLNEAGAAGMPVILQVVETNPAARLYLRLGFEPQGGDGIYRFMRWSPLKPVAIT